MGDLMMHRRQTGMTLIELMIVVVIIAILASIAYPSYRQYVIRANRTEAKTQLLQLSQVLEKCYTRFHDYGAACGIDLAPATENYTISAVVTPQAYTLTATPSGAQVEDTKCGALLLDNTNKRGEKGALSVKPENKCW